MNWDLLDLKATYMKRKLLFGSGYLEGKENLKEIRDKINKITSFQSRDNIV